MKEVFFCAKDQLRLSIETRIFGSTWKLCAARLCLRLMIASAYMSTINLHAALVYGHSPKVTTPRTGGYHYAGGRAYGLRTERAANDRAYVDWRVKKGRGFCQTSDKRVDLCLFVCFVCTPAHRPYTFRMHMSPTFSKTLQYCLLI